MDRFNFEDNIYRLEQITSIILYIQMNVAEGSQLNSEHLDNALYFLNDALSELVGKFRVNLDEYLANNQWDMKHTLQYAKEFEAANGRWPYDSSELIQWLKK